GVYPLEGYATFFIAGRIKTRVSFILFSALEVAQIMATDSTNANTLIKEQVANFLVQPLERASVILNAGATVFNSSEPLRIPTIAEGVNPTWVGENELIPEDEVTTGEISLMPTNRKSLKVITRVSNELIRMATVGVSNVLEQRIVSDVRTKLDDALLSGDGAANSITGLLNQPGVTNGAFDASDPDSIIDAIGSLNALEVNPNRIIVSGADFTSLRKLKDNGGRYLLTPDITAGAVGSSVGTRVSVTSTFDASDPDSIIDAIGSLNALEVNPNRIIVSGADFTSLRKLKDNGGRYLLTPDITAGAVGSLFGIPVSVTNKLEAGTAIVGDMSA